MEVLEGESVELYASVHCAYPAISWEVHVTHGQHGWKMLNFNKGRLNQ